MSAVELPSEEKAEKFGVQTTQVFCKANTRQLTQISELVDAGQLETHVLTVLPFAQIKEAHRLSKTGYTRGKIVLRIGE